MISWIGQIEFIREEFWFKNDIVYRLFKLVSVLRNTLKLLKKFGR